MKRFFLTVGCSLFFILLAVILCFAISVVLLTTSARAAALYQTATSSYISASNEATPTITIATAEEGSAYRLAQAQHDVPAAKEAQSIYLHLWIDAGVHAQGCALTLAGDASGAEPFAVDDRLTLVAHLAGGQSRVWQKDFRSGGAVARLAPVDVTDALGPDLHSLEIIMEDLQPSTYGNTELWLIACGNHAPTSVSATATATNPARETSSPTPTIIFTASTSITSTSITSTPTSQGHPTEVTALPISLSQESDKASPTPKNTMKTPTQTSAPFVPSQTGGGQNSDIEVAGTTQPPTSNEDFPSWPLVGITLLAFALFGAGILFIRSKINNRTRYPAKVSHIVSLFYAPTGEQEQQVVASLPVGVNLFPLEITASPDEAQYNVVKQESSTQEAAPKYILVPTSDTKNAADNDDDNDNTNATATRSKLRDWSLLQVTLDGLPVGFSAALMQ